jgi:hypothetical protein
MPRVAARAVLALALCCALRCAAAPAPARRRLSQEAPPSSELVASLAGGVFSAALGDGLRCLDPAYPEDVLVTHDAAPQTGFDYSCRFLAATLLAARDAAQAAADDAAATYATTSTAADLQVRPRRGSIEASAARFRPRESGFEPLLFAQALSAAVAAAEAAQATLVAAALDAAPTETSEAQARALCGAHGRNPC